MISKFTFGSNFSWGYDGGLGLEKRFFSQRLGAYSKSNDITKNSNSLGLKMHLNFQKP